MAKNVTLSFIPEILIEFLRWARDCVRGSGYDGKDRQGPALGELKVYQRTGH